MKTLEEAKEGQSEMRNGNERQALQLLLLIVLLCVCFASPKIIRVKCCLYKIAARGHAYKRSHIIHFCQFICIQEIVNFVYPPDVCMCVLCI